MTPDIKILVVDDREDNLLSIETILERENYTIVKANSGKAALKILLTQHDFSLILMDVQMPDMNGLETASMIFQRDKLKNIPIIFITAHSHEEEAIYKGYKLGAVDFIYKPVNPELLRLKVGLFAELFRKTQQLVAHEQKLLNTNAYLQKEIEERLASEQKVMQLNMELQQNNVHLKSINEELDRFAYIASHDLQEPLRKIKLFSDLLLQKKGSPEDMDKYLGKIKTSTDRMHQLVNDLLQFSRHHVDDSDFVEANLNNVVKEAIGELEVQINQSNANIVIDQLPSALIIPSLMRRVFYNVISNALKFKKKEETPLIRIQAQTHCSLEVNGGKNGTSSYCKIFITDNGIGFDKKYADDIFVVFKRLHSYHEIEGTGIGLSICKKIMERHNGQISATSELGQGSVFTIVIPERK